MYHVLPKFVKQKINYIINYINIIYTNFVYYDKKNASAILCFFFSLFLFIYTLKKNKKK